MEAIRPSVQRIVDELIDGMLAGPKPVDLVTEFALPVPSLVICTLLGVPYADHEFFQRTSSLLLSARAPVDTVVAAQEDLMAYLEDLVGRKLENPTDDLLSVVGAQQVRTGRLSRADLARMGDAAAGRRARDHRQHDLPGHGGAAGAPRPVRGTAGRRRPGPDPGRGRGTVAVPHDHALRPAQGRVGRHRDRRPRHPCGRRHGAGARRRNRDGDTFPDPDHLDVRRDARRHVAFGFGVHQCLGQPLARMELQVVYGTLYRRIPTMRLATPLADVPFKHDGLVYGVHELPITW
jgi:cytochrome P450